MQRFTRSIAVTTADVPVLFVAVICGAGVMTNCFQPYVFVSSETSGDLTKFRSAPSIVAFDLVGMINNVDEGHVLARLFAPWGMCPVGASGVQATGRGDQRDRGELRLLTQVAPFRTGLPYGIQHDLGRFVTR